MPEPRYMVPDHALVLLDPPDSYCSASLLGQHVRLADHTTTAGGWTACVLCGQPVKGDSERVTGDTLSVNHARP